MANTRVLSLNTGVDLRGLRGGLSKANKTISTFSANIPKIAGGVALGNLISGAITSGLSKLSGAATSAMSSMFEITLDNQKIEAQFSTLTGDVGTAKSLIGDLKDFAANTPFEFKTLADAGKQLLTVFDPSDIEGKLQKLGDVSAAYGSDIGELSTLYARAANDQILYTEAINQFNDRGIPVYKMLAEQLGTNTLGVKKMASEGQIGFDKLEKVFDTLTAAGGTANGGMKTLSETTGGLISTLRDNFSAVLAKFGEKLFKIFNVNDKIKSMISTLQNIGPTVDFVLGYLEKGINTVRPLFDAVIGYYGKIFTAWKNTIVDIYSVFGSFSSDGITSSISTVVDWIDWLGDGVVTAIGWVKKLSPIAIGVFDIVAASAKLLVDSFLTGFKMMWDWTSSFFTMFGVSGGSALESFTIFTVTGLATIEAAIVNAKDVLAGLFNLFVLGGTIAINSATHWAEQIYNAFSAVGNNIGEFVGTTFVNIIKLFEYAWQNISSLVTNSWALITGEVDLKDVLKEMEGDFQSFQFKPIDFTARVSTDYENLLAETVANQGKNIADNMAKTIESRVNDAKKLINGFKSDMAVPAFNPIYKDGSTNKDGSKDTGDTTAAKDKKVEFSGLNTVGSQSARDILLARIGGAKKEDKTLETSKKQLTEQEKQNKKLDTLNTNLMNTYMTPATIA